MTADKTIELTAALLKHVGKSDWRAEIVDTIIVDSDVPPEWRFGVAFFSRKTIQFQRAAITRESDSVVRELIAHEVCHSWWGNTAEDHSTDFLVEVSAFKRRLDKLFPASTNLKTILNHQVKYEKVQRAAIEDATDEGFQLGIEDELQRARKSTK